MTVINFGQVAVGSDPVFGAIVYSEDGWVPFSFGSEEEQEWVRKQVINSPFRRCLLSGMEEALFGKPSVVAPAG